MQNYIFLRKIVRCCWERLLLTITQKTQTKAIKFGTQVINGNKIIIEYREPVDAAFEGELSVTKIIHVFEKSGPFIGGNGAQFCEINVSCSEGNGWEQEINSVGIILGYNSINQLQGYCTGTLLNNTSEDGTPYFLTARHCLDQQPFGVYDPSTWLFLFNHQTPICSSDGSDISSYTGQSIYGALIRSSDGVSSPTTDYLLLELNAAESTLASYGVCYAGWSLISSPQPPFITIHHPSGDVKKISISPNAAQSTSWFSTIVNPNGNHWKIKWNNSDPPTNGITEGGSSGAPLFDNNHKVIGQLHGGLSSCTGFWMGNNFVGPEEPDWYGKFSTSWQNGGFAFWLDPYNTHQTSVNTYCPVYTGPGGGGGGGGGGSSNACAMPNDRKLANGFFVNGKRTK